MREYRDELRKAGINVHYFELTTRKEKQNYSKLLKTFINNHRVTKLDLFENEDKDLRKFKPLLKLYDQADIINDIV